MLWDPFLYCINDSIQGNSETGNKVFVLPSKVDINKIGVSQQTISKYEKVDENISGDMLLALSKFFKVPVDYILRKDEEEQQREQDNKREIMELYRDMDQYNRDTWIIIGKRLLGGQLHKYNEDSIIEKRLKE